jgi:hypothetical protein
VRTPTSETSPVAMRLPRARRDVTKEYWIVDAMLEQVVILRWGRSGWTETTLGPADACETKLLPGFKLPCRTVFEAAGEE